MGETSPVRSGGNIRAKRNLKRKMNKMRLLRKKVKSSQEHSLTMAEMFLPKSEVGKTENKEQRKSQCKAVSIFKFKYAQDGGKVVKNNPDLWLVLSIVLRQHHLVHLETQTLEASLISTCLQSLAGK